MITTVMHNTPTVYFQNPFSHHLYFAYERSIYSIYMFWSENSSSTCKCAGKWCPSQALNFLISSLNVSTALVNVSIRFLLFLNTHFKNAIALVIKEVFCITGYQYLHILYIFFTFDCKSIRSLKTISSPISRPPIISP